MSSLLRSLPTPHRRRHSWPPIKLKPARPPVKPQSAAGHLWQGHVWPAREEYSINVDDDPFSHFLSRPPELSSDESEEYIHEYMRADIGLPDVRGVHSTSPRRTAYHSHGQFTKKSTTAMTKLRRWMRYMDTCGAKHRHSQFEDPELPKSRKRKASTDDDLDGDSPEFQPSHAAFPTQHYQPVVPSRGRYIRRRMSASSCDSGRSSTHSEKPRVWREPQTDIWPLVEDDEG